MTNELVSIIMLSRNNGKYVEETVRSVFAQTYQNWEIVFRDDSSKDDTISQIMNLVSESRIKREDGSYVNRIHVSQTVTKRGTARSTNSALKEVRGRWIAFLNVGSVWEPTKLEKQIAFMEENGYAFSYTKYGLINEKSEDKGVVYSGLKHITYKDMLKCCWPGCLTVMYDSEKIGKMQIRNLHENNDYALWLNICEKADCYLLNENLARQRATRNIFLLFLFSNQLKWRYRCYRIEEDLNPFVSLLYSFRNGFYGIWKKIKYVERGKYGNTIDK